jgi:hypothetical protein
MNNNEHPTQGKRQAHMAWGIHGGSETAVRRQPCKWLPQQGSLPVGCRVVEHGGPNNDLESPWIPHEIRAWAKTKHSFSQNKIQRISLKHED